jgi:type II secretory pathway pseudopilin PulG
MRQLCRLTVAAAILGMLAPVLLVSASQLQAKAKKIDLADVVAGAYHGDVISDARGSSQSDVMISVDKVAPGTVRVTSDYERIPERTFQLTRALQTIQNQGGEPGEVFLYDQAKSPDSLMLTIDDASWSGVKE